MVGRCVVGFEEGKIDGMVVGLDDGRNEGKVLGFIVG
jgi:hypothetical protein